MNDKYKLDLPEIPDGMTFAPDTFWHKYRRKFKGIHPPKEHDFDWFNGQEAQAALYNRQFPPRPVFAKVYGAVPQPWDGRNERGGRVPRTGK